MPGAAPAPEPAPRARLQPRAAGVVALLLPLAVAVALPALTREHVTVPPSRAVLVVAVALFVLAGLLPARLDRRWDVLVAVGFAACASHTLLLRPGLPRTHDLIPHFWGTWAFAQEVWHGALWPRWLHQLDLGSPLPRFYGPLSFYPAVPLLALGLSSAAAFKGIFVIHAVVATLAMLLVAGDVSADRRAALVAAGAYALAPYRLLDTGYRGALGESAALALLPLVLHALVRAGDAGMRRLPVAAVLVAALALAHPLSVPMVSVGAGLWIVAERARPHRWHALARTLGAAAAAVLVGVALAGPFVVPMLVELRHTSLELLAHQARSPRVAEHGVHTRQLVERRLWSELLDSRPEGPGADGGGREMPFYIGIALLAVASLPALLRAERRSKGNDGCGVGTPRSPATAASATGPAAVATGGVLLALTPGARLLAHAPGLSAMQFSWRFLGLASVGLCLLAAIGVARLLARRGPLGVVITIALGALLAIDAWPDTGAADWVAPYRGLAHFYRVADCGEGFACWRGEQVTPPPGRLLGTFLPPSAARLDVAAARAGYPEYTTPTLWRAFLSRGDMPDPGQWGIALHGAPDRAGVERFVPLPYARRLASPAAGDDDGGAVALRARRGAGRIEVELPGRAGTVIVLEQAFPGWQVHTADGWRAAEQTRDGLLRAEVREGQRQLLLRVEPWPWDRVAGMLLAVLALAILVAMRVRARRASPGASEVAAAPW